MIDAWGINVFGFDPKDREASILLGKIENSGSPGAPEAGPSKAKDL
jgi:hypothetical protein